MWDFSECVIVIVIAMLRNFSTLLIILDGYSVFSDGLLARTIKQFSNFRKVEALMASGGQHELTISVSENIQEARG